MNIKIMMVIAVGCVAIGQCIFGQLACDARSRGMAGITSLPGDPFAAANNPAWMVGTNRAFLGLSSNNKFLLKEMKDFHLTINYGLKKDALGMSISVAGLQPYLKQIYTVSYSKVFGERIHSGISLEYLHFNSTEATQAVYAATFKAGLGIILSDKLSFSFCGINPLGLAIASKDSYFTPKAYITGLTYTPSDGLLLAAELKSSTETGMSIKGALEYVFMERFALRAGCLSHPFRVTFGAGLTYRLLCIDLASEYHSYLGFSPSVSISYHIDIKKYGDK